MLTKRGLIQVLFAVVLAAALAVPLMGPLAPAAEAAETGFQPPTAPHSPNQWTNAGNALFSDNSRATENTSGDMQGYSGFGFTFTPPSPYASLDITGIEVNVEAMSCDSSGCDIRVYLSWNNGSSWAGPQTVDLTNSETPWHSVGASNDDWGRSWTADQLSNANFVVMVEYYDPGTACSCTSGTMAQLDYLEADVYYNWVCEVPGIDYLNAVSSFLLQCDQDEPEGLGRAPGSTFFVAEDNSDESVYKYTGAGAADGSFDIGSSTDNDDPSGVAYSGGTVYVLDSDDDRVYNWQTDGTFIKRSKQLRDGGGSGIESPRGIAIDGDDMWIVCDTDSDELYRYSLSNAFAGDTSGNINALQHIDLNGSNRDGQGLAIGSTYLYVLDGDDEMFYRYQRDGLGSAAFSPMLKDEYGNDLNDARGATLDGASMWVVDNDRLRVYEYPLSLLFPPAPVFILTPVTDVNPIDTDHTVFAAIAGDTGGTTVGFNVTAGPNSGESGVDTTDACGVATWTYPGDDGVGTDTIQAVFTPVGGGSVSSNEVSKTWVDLVAQLGVILDGSGSISDVDWGYMIDGLAAAVRDVQCVPHDGSVELTVVQFGNTSAHLEVGPVIVTAANAEDVAVDIEGICKLDGESPIACGIYLAADVMAGDPNGNLVGTPWEGRASPHFGESMKQVLNIATDGDPNRCCPDDTGDCAGGGGCYDPWDCPDARASAEDARDYAVSLLGVDTDPQDEFDAEFFGTVDADRDWLRDAIVWPQPGNLAPPYAPGWVSSPASAVEFKEGVCAKIPHPEILIDMDVLTPIVVAGGQAQYTINVTNDGSAAATNASISANLAAPWFTYASTGAIVETGGAVRFSTDPTPGTTTPLWGYWNIPPGGGVLIPFTVDVDADVPAGTYDSNASTNGDNFGPVDDDGLVGGDPGTPGLIDDQEEDEDVTVEPPEVLIDMDVLTPNVVPGGQAQYRINVTNVGGAAATNASIWATLPAPWFTYASTGFVVETGGAVRSSTDPTPGTTTPLWGYWKIPPGGGVLIPFTVDVGTGITTGTYDSNAFTSGDNFGPVDDDGLVDGDPGTPPGDDPEEDEDVIVAQPAPFAPRVPVVSGWGVVGMAILLATLLAWSLWRRRVLGGRRS